MHQIMLRCTIKINSEMAGMNDKLGFRRYHQANLLVLQGALRVNGLIGIGALSAWRKFLDLYLLCLRPLAAAVPTTDAAARPEQALAAYLDTLGECVEASWQDFRNHLQIVLLTQDELLIWIARIDRALAAEAVPVADDAASRG